MFKIINNYKSDGIISYTTRTEQSRRSESFIVKLNSACDHFWIFVYSVITAGFETHSICLFYDITHYNLANNKILWKCMLQQFHLGIMKMFFFKFFSIIGKKWFYNDYLLIWFFSCGRIFLLKKGSVLYEWLYFP